jgi:centromeric protein E
LTQILDEKSLIKKYQKEITSLKTELEQLKHSILEQPFIVNTSQEDLVHLRQQVSVQFKSMGCVFIMLWGLQP